jgi:hypothetical protein
MSAIEADSKTLEAQTCPLCDTPLDPQHPNECSRCDWVREPVRVGAASRPRDRDVASVLLSVVPGLGHLYKGHTLQGMLFMTGGLFAVFAVSVIATFTMGLGVLLLPLYWVGVMMHVYWLEDYRIPKSSRA